MGTCSKSSTAAEPPCVCGHDSKCCDPNYKWNGQRGIYVPRTSCSFGTNAREEAFKVLCTRSRSLVHIPVMSSFASQKRIGPTTHSVVSLVFPAPGLALGRINVVLESRVEFV